MKSYITFPNIIYFILISIIFNNYMLVKDCPCLLIFIIPLFAVLNIIPGLKVDGTSKKSIRLYNHGTAVLVIFVWSIVPSLLWHIFLAFRILPERYDDFIFSALYCTLMSALLFWNGIICVYSIFSQMRLKWRVIGALCGMIPIVNMIVLTKIINITSGEVEVGLKKEYIASNPVLLEICKTKYPIVFVHGLFFRDNKIFNYWGRIPSNLEMHGATVYYGNHQSALTIKESAREIATRIKVIVEHSGCEKVNIIAHSKGGLDCRYAISEFDLAPYVASLTTVNTPHRGSLFAEKLLYHIPEKMKNKVAEVYNTVLKAIGDENPDFLAAVNDITAESCKMLNEQLTFPEGIYAQSIGSVMEHSRNGRFPLNLLYRYVKNYDGENDGLLGESSFGWGERYTLLRIDGKRGISHGDVVDLNRKNIRGFDVCGFYMGLVKELRERGC